ncbi:hypothetical protein [Vampirovibrio chlorellavorus]|uniref:hypothetical protein n=1 Tax=Vampirovibrio chlorellavorus TaxID=758823 RepID=UPI0026EA8D5A|nr:hypothetical protein [Vampirovibrio chlorellavorus]
MPLTHAHATVESFQIRLEGWSSLLQEAEPLAVLEERLLHQLETPARLLRWAVVRVDLADPMQPFWCEGAYLKN